MSSWCDKFVFLFVRWQQITCRFRSRRMRRKKLRSPRAAAVQPIESTVRLPGNGVINCGQDASDRVERNFAFQLETIDEIRLERIVAAELNSFRLQTFRDLISKFCFPKKVRSAG